MRVISHTPGAGLYLAPDLAFDGVSGDFVLAAADAANAGGFRADNALLTAVAICLFTDRRVEAYELRDGDENRGWPGDGFDIGPGDYVLGSRLWLLRRRALTAETILLADDYVREALQPLLDQGAFARFDVAVAAPGASVLTIDVSGYGRADGAVFNAKFDILWDQVK